MRWSGGRNGGEYFWPPLNWRGGQLHGRPMLSGEIRMDFLRAAMKKNPEVGEKVVGRSPDDGLSTASTESLKPETGGESGTTSLLQTSMQSRHDFSA